MGAEPYLYFVPYQADVLSALQALREQEFKAGRYNPVIPSPGFVDPDVAPGAQHASIQAAIEAAGADGTGSILDIDRVAQEPDYGVAAPLSNETLLEIFGTDKPSHEMAEEDMAFLEDIERGQCAYFVVYQGDVPVELCFAGYSYD